MKLTTWSIRILFLSIFIIIGTYILFYETERYESQSTVLLSDLSKKQEVSLGALLGDGTEVAKDSQVLEIFIKSYEMYKHLDHKFRLTYYYTHDQIDSYQRLYKDALLPQYRVNKKNLLKSYNRDLSVLFDNLSETITLKFAHADANLSQQILREIIFFSDKTINDFSRENAKISLKFIAKQVEENRANFIQSIQKLIQYQQEHMTFDPMIDIERKSKILAELEADLAKREVEYHSKLKTGWNKNGYEMKTLRANILDLKAATKKLKEELSGNLKPNKKLNSSVFDYKVLENEMEFAKEVYKETLINQEKLKIEVSQNAKHLVVVTQPTKPDAYTYPDKIWDLFTLTLILLFFYTIIMTVIAILRDHID